MVRMIGRVIWIGVIAVGGGGIFYATHPAARSCEDLVRIANVSVAAGNAVTSPDQIDGALTQFRATAAQLRAAASDYKDPFGSDARLDADALDEIGYAVSNSDAAGVGRAIDHFNTLVDRTNSDCSGASGGVDGK
jgi:hypothetical protein